MKIAVMGAGGVGGYFGARLAAAGHEVGFVARGAHLGAIRANGLSVASQLGDILLRPARASDDPAAFGPAEIVLFAVKAYDCAAAAEALRPALGPETGVVPLLNGVDHIDTLRRILGPERVLGGVANISALIEAPGVVRHFDRLQILRFGEMDNSASARATAFREACAGAGIDCPVPNDIERELWQKMAMICALAGANCLTRLPLGPCRSDPATRALLADLVAETCAVARARGVPLPGDQEARSMELLDKLPAGMKASMLAALERGERLEASALNGAIDRLGRAAGVETPMHRAVYAALAPRENGAPAA